MNRGYMAGLTRPRSLTLRSLSHNLLVRSEYRLYGFAHPALSRSIRPIQTVELRLSADADTASRSRPNCRYSGGMSDLTEGRTGSRDDWVGGFPVGSNPICEAGVKMGLGWKAARLSLWLLQAGLVPTELFSQSRVTSSSKHQLDEARKVLIACWNGQHLLLRCRAPLRLSMSWRVKYGTGGRGQKVLGLSA